MTFDEIFSHLEALMIRNANKLRGSEDVSVNLIITGQGGGTIGLSVANGQPAFTRTAIASPDAQIALSGSDLIAILERRQNPMLAIMTGRIKISGDTARLMRIVKAIS